MYKVVGGTDIKDYHLYSWNKNKATVGLGNFRAVSNPREHLRHVMDAMSRVGLAGRVGQMLERFALQSPDLEIVCWPGVPGEFMCAAEIGQHIPPTIMWDPYTCFQYFSRDLSQVPESERGERAPQIVMKPAVMPSWMVLGHELGHYVHWATKTNWFEECVRNGDIAGIERENLKDHEKPMLEAAGLPSRSSYQDFRGGANDPAKTTNKHITSGGVHSGDPETCYPYGQTLAQAKSVLDKAIAQSAGALRSKKAAANEKAASESVITQQCPKCNQTFASAVKLMLHRRASKDCGF